VRLDAEVASAADTGGFGSATAATRLPATPEIGMQDGWIDRGHAHTLDEGCSSNDENELA